MVRMSTLRAARSSKTSEEFVHLFAHADDDAGLGDLLRVEFLDLFEEAQGARVAAAGFGDAVEARHGFDVVIEDLGGGVDD